MKTIREHLRNKILNDLGVIYSMFPDKSITDLMSSEWSYEFEELMRLNLVIGAIRYGPLSNQEFKSYTKEIKKRLQLYERSGNVSFLVDIANFALIEYVKGFHSNKNSKIVDDQIHYEDK